mgnify:CR=1 FL=1
MPVAPHAWHLRHGSARKASAASRLQPSSRAIMETAMWGGSKQRVSTAYLQGAQRQRSQLAQYLYRDHLWGGLSLPKVQHIAALAEKDFRDVQAPEELRRLSRLGSHGAYPNNLRRDLLRLVGPPAMTGGVVQVPLQADGCSVLGSLPFLPPRESFLALQARPCFRELISPGPDCVQEFWRHVGGHPALVNHPVRAVAGFERRAIPVVVHGDAVPCTQRKSAAFISWRSLLCTPQPSRLAHVFVTAIWTEHIASGRAGKTLPSLLRKMQQSMQQLQDEAAEDACFPVLVFATGDLEWFSSAHQLPRWNAQRPCGLCSVEKENLFDYKSVAKVAVDPWTVPQTISPAGIVPDLMHTKHLGCDQRLLGGALWELCFDMMPNSPEANMRQVFLEMKAWPMHPCSPAARLHACLACQIFRV